MEREGSVDYIIEGEDIKSIDAFYDLISKQLGLASWFGRNLDALNDVLRGGCGTVDPANKTWKWLHHTISKENISRFDTIVRIFNEHPNGIKLILA